ncbi:MAG: VOC family protein [Anaerolineae bacterium]|nr:VOC family protein [Anaerolineae bacterium]
MLELNMFGDGAVFDHVGLAVRSIEATLDGNDEATIFDDNIQKVSVAFIRMNGIKVELIEPLGEKTPVALSLKKGQQLVHLCFRVPDIEAAIEKGREHGFHCIARPVPAVAFGCRRIAWLFSRVYGLVEIVEMERHG